MITTILKITDVYGSELAAFTVNGDILSATVALPGYSDEAWLPLAAKLKSLGMNEETLLALGPLLRFTVERKET